MTELLPDDPRLRAVCEALAGRPEPIYLVGGYVRDWLLGRANHDLDFAVVGRAIPIARDIANRFRGSFVPLDPEHDTARVVFMVGGEQYYVDLAGIRGADIVADLQARDLTLNAIAINVHDISSDVPHLLDPTGGVNDIAARRIRATSEGSFRDDPLRLLRAVRHAAILGFRITPQTESWIERDAHLIVGIAWERIRAELTQLVAAPQASDWVRHLDQYGLLRHVLPELVSLNGVSYPPGQGDALEITLRALDGVEALLASLAPPAGPEAQAAAWIKPFQQHEPIMRAHFGTILSEARDRGLLLRFAALLHALGAGHAQDALRRLRFTTNEVELATWTIRAREEPVQIAREAGGEELAPRTTYRCFQRHGDSGVDILALSIAAAWGSGLAATDPPAWSSLISAASQLLDYYTSEWPRVAALPRLVDGRTLMRELGLEGGPLIGELLEGIRESQALGEISTVEEALAWARAQLAARETSRKRPV